VAPSLNPGNSRLRMLGAGARTDDCKPFQPIDSTEIWARVVLVELGGIASGLVWSCGWHVDCFIEPGGDQVNRDA
jgi:hypothetical protein